MNLPAILVRGNPAVWEPAAFRPEPFCELHTGRHLIVEMQYPKLQMQQACERCLLREEAAKRLEEASCYLQELLPGAKLKIWDAWRPFALQQELYYAYRGDILRQFHMENQPFAAQEAIVRKYVSLPDENRVLPPVHTTGGAVDVTITEADGTDLPMGCAFDAFADETETAYFERMPQELSAEDIKRWKRIRDHRRILYAAMTRAGFVNLPSEWWHFDYGDRFWAWAKQKPALYRGVFTEEETKEEAGL